MMQSDVEETAKALYASREYAQVIDALETLSYAREKKFAEAASIYKNELTDQLRSNYPGLQGNQLLQCFGVGAFPRGEA